MDILEFGVKYEDKCVMCLGYFDSIHKGHVYLINKAKEIAKTNNCKLAVFIFTGGKNKSLDVFSYEERLIKLKALDVDVVLYKELDEEFMSIKAEEFLNTLFEFYNISNVVTGQDYTFGKDAIGNVNYLKEYLKNKKVEYTVIDKITSENGEKISTKDIKIALLNGNIIKANELLGSNYFIRERIIEGKKLGRNLGFPTANMLLSSCKLKIKEGVYLTLAIIDGRIYSGITNVGRQPTVEGKNFVIESHFKDYSGDLYNKILSVYFVDRIRDVIEFSSISELQNQLKKDLELLV